MIIYKKGDIINKRYKLLTKNISSHDKNDNI